MPLPKKKVNDWKRKIGFKVMKAKNYDLQIVKSTKPSEMISKKSTIRKDILPSELTNKELLFWHVKLHAMYKNKPHGWSLEDIVNLHTLIVQEMKKRNLKHKPYDRLDEISRQFLIRLSSNLFIPEKYSKNVKKLNDNILLEDHKIVHEWWESLQFGKIFKHPEAEEITKEDVIELHDIIINELEKRGFKHTTPLDERLAEIPDRVEKIKDELNEAVLIENFVTMIGSYITTKEKPSDIDFLLRFDKGTPEFIERATRVRIAKMLKNIPEDIQFTTDPEGPHDDYIPLFDLILRPKKLELIELTKEVILGSAYSPQKPAGSATYILEDILKKIKNKTYTIEKKLNGFHVTIHKQENEIKIFSEHQKNLTIAFPTLTSALKKVSTHDFVIDGELVPITGGRRALAVFIGAVKRGEKVDDRNVNLYVWDITYFDKDIHLLSLNKRKQILKKLKFSKRIIHTPYIKTKGKNLIKKAIKKISALKDSEGAVIKDLDASYRFGEAVWFKHRNLADIHAVILKQIPTKKSNVYNYYFGIYVSEDMISKINSKYLKDFNNKKVLLIGKTFNTKEKAKPGDIVDILVEEVWRHKKENKIRYSAHKPRFKMLRPDIKETSSLKDLDSIVVSVGIEVKE